MKRRVGEFVELAEARAEREDMRGPVTSTIVHIGRAVSYVLMRMGQWFFYGLAIYALWTSEPTNTVLLYVIWGLILRHSMVATRVAAISIAHNRENVIRTNDPDRVNDEMQPPVVF